MEGRLMIFVLLIFLLFSLWLSYQLHGKEIPTPSFIFNLSFTFSCAIATLYFERWELGLHFDTFLTILGGSFLFTFVSIFTHHLYRRFNGKGITNIQEDKAYHIDNWKTLLFIGISSISIIWSIYFLRHNVNETTLARIIYAYRYANVFTERHITMPKTLGYLRSFTMAVGYFYAFVLGNNFAINKRVNILHLAIVVLSAISASLTGGRQNAINLIVSIFAAFLLFRQKKHGAGKSLSLKKMAKYGVIALIVSWAFKSGGELIGRSNKSVSLFDYIAKYCGAEIKNLDIFLSNRTDNSNTLWGMQTFYSFRSWIGKELPVRDLPFNVINEFNLGNVYTTYYDYIYDFGYLGILPLISIMAFLMQLLYEKVRWGKNNNRMVFWYVLFGYEFPNILFSFFSNEFYIYNLSSVFVQYCLFWIVIKIFCLSININIKKSVLLIR